MHLFLYVYVFILFNFYLQFVYTWHAQVFLTCLRHKYAAEREMERERALSICARAVVQDALGKVIKAQYDNDRPITSPANWRLNRKAKKSSKTSHADAIKKSAAKPRAFRLIGQNTQKQRSHTVEPKTVSSDAAIAVNNKLQEQRKRVRERESAKQNVTIFSSANSWVELTWALDMTSTNIINSWAKDSKAVMQQVQERRARERPREGDNVTIFSSWVKLS